MKRMNLIKGFFGYFIPLILWMGLIFFLSNQSSVGVGVSLPAEILIRKWVHIVVFGFLALLFLRFISYFFDYLSLKNQAIWSIFLATMYAFFDEIHQAFIPGRFGSALDVLVDFTGINLFIFGVIFYLSHKKDRKKYFFLLAIIFIFANLLIIFLIEKNTNIFIERIVKSRSYQEISSKEKSSIVALQKINSSAGSDELENENDSLYLVDNLKQVNLPEKILIEVPFTSQAPLMVWDEIHKEACEEASLIMVKWFFLEENLTPEIAEREILALKDYQVEFYGDFRDSDMKTLAEIARDFYGINHFSIIEKFEISDLKKYLAQGSPIIIPSAGRRLNNPNFIFPGPLYHNLVLIGYDDEREVFITNDPGTRNGERFEYDQQLLLETIRDFPGDKNKIEQGTPRILVFD